MSSPIYGLMKQQHNDQFVKQLQQFKNTFRGDPGQALNQLLQSGRVTQEQLNRATQIANQYKGMLPK
jgi:F0F1-type ATP synthase delta subunit